MVMIKIFNTQTGKVEQVEKVVKTDTVRRLLANGIA